MTEAAVDDAKFPEAPTNEPTRQWLLLRMRQILEIALERVTNPKTPAADRIKWSRVIISAGQVSNGILRDVEIESLKQQIMELKALTMEKLKKNEEGEDEDDDSDSQAD